MQKILIIEDTVTIAELIADILQKENYYTEIAHTGKEAFKLLKTNEFNLILLDLVLPDIQGIEILKKVRKQYYPETLPVLILSVIKEESKIAKHLDLGANDFLTKPFSELILKTKVKNLVQLQLNTLENQQLIKTVKENEQQLKRLNTDKDRFIRIIGHDLSSPFNTLLGLSTLLLRKIHKYDKDKIKQNIEIINLTARNTYNLLCDLLLWSKSQAGKLPFEPENIKFNDICNKVVKEKQVQANHKDIKIRYFAPESTLLYADTNMLKTILRNLISNAIKFTHQGGKVEIRAYLDKQSTVINVADNGIGITEDTQRKLWDFANPLTTPGTNKEKGTGLGLLLCKEFVEHHGGEIWVESEPGKGSEFKFSLPVNH
jgi:signal transduction histidine kinase